MPIPTIGKLIKLAFLFGLAALAATQAPLFAETNAVTVTAPSSSGVTLAPLDEYSSDVLNDIWDMDQITDLTYHTDYPEFLSNPRFEDGFYKGTLEFADGRERINLLAAGAPNNTALRTGKIGYNFPIDADKYRYLTFRMFSNYDECSSGLIQWFAEDTYTTSVEGVSKAFAVPPQDPPSGLPDSDCSNGPYGWHLYTIDLKSNGIQSGGRPWEGTIRELILHPFAGAGAAGSEVQLDYAQLTVQNPRSARPYTVRWSDGSGNVEIYASPDNKSRDSQDVLLANNVSASSGSQRIQTGLLPPGEYYIAVVNGGDTSWSPGKLIIKRKPKVVIQKPSKTSGQEYATSVLGNAWDMNDREDATPPSRPPWQVSCMESLQVSNGVFSGVVPNPICGPGGNVSDPIIYLGHMSPVDPIPPINTDKYRYLAFRMRLDGVRQADRGWVARFGWWQVAKPPDSGPTTTEEVVMSRDIIIFTGWNTYKLDLWRDDLFDEAHPIKRTWRDSAPNQLRIDPAEFLPPAVPNGVALDWVGLYAMDTVDQGSVFPILYDYEESAEMTFYRDADTNPDNGRTRIGSHTATSTCSSDSGNAPVEDELAYMPMIVNGSSSSTPDSDGCFNWDTDGTPAGNYFICIEADDGVSESYTCSEAPMVVQ